MKSSPGPAKALGIAVPQSILLWEIFETGTGRHVLRESAKDTLLTAQGITNVNVTGRVLVM